MLKCKVKINTKLLDLVTLILLSATLPLFFYKLGQASLVSWDEAWYGEIARNILKSADLLNLKFNGGVYFDHPPLGFWLEALVFKIFGINEFWARFPQALSGFLGIGILYFLGKELFGKVVGLASGVALASSFWYIARARSGNLDTLLTVMFVLTLYLAIKAIKNKNYYPFFFISLALLFLTKTLVPLTIIPALLLIFWKSKTLKFKNLILPGILFLIIFGSWFIPHYLKHTNFLERLLFIGYPGVEAKTSFFDNLGLMKQYLHSGIGKWFWPGILGVVAGSIFFQKRFLILSLFFITFFAPFLFSNKGQIWHLIPLYPFMILAFFGFLYVFLEKFIKNIMVVNIIIFIIVINYSSLQIRQMWYQFIDIPAYVSDEAILSREAGKHPQDFYIDSDFGPAAAFYSGKHVEKIWDGGLPELFEKNSFVLITQQWRLDKYNISQSKYQILKKDRDKILVLKTLSSVF